MKKLLIVIVFIFIFFGLIKWSSPTYFLSDNNSNFFLGNYLYNYQSLKIHGQFAHINWYQALGNLHHAQGQTGVFYPLVYVSFGIADLFLKNPLLGIDILTLIHWLMAGIGMFGFLKYYKKNEELSAIFLSLIWITSPFLVGVGRNWIVVTILMGLLPFIFWSLELIKTKPTKFNQLFFISFHLLLILQGYIQWVLMVGIFEFLFLLFKSESKNWQNFLTANWMFIKLWIITSLLGSIVWLPLFRNVQNSVARGQILDIKDFILNTVDPTIWALAQFGKFSDEVYFNGSSYILFSPWIWIILFIFILGYRKKKVNSKNGSVYAKLGLIALICSTQIYLLAYKIPILNWFRWPFKYYPFVLLFFVIWIGVWSSKLYLKSKQIYFFNIVAAFVILAQVYVVLNNASHDLAFAPNHLAGDYQLKWIDLYLKDPSRIFIFGVDEVDSPYSSQLSGHNYSTINQTQFFGAYDATLNLKLWQEIKGVPAFGYLGDEIENDTLEYLKSWGVGYYVTSNKQAAIKLTAQNSDFEIINHENVYLIKDKGKVLANAFWQDNLEAIDYNFSPQGLNLYPASTKSGEIVLNIFDWQSYKAKDLDSGKFLPIRSSLNRPVITLDQPTTEIQVWYTDPSFNQGVYLSMLGLLIFIVDLRFNLFSKHET